MGNLVASLGKLAAKPGRQTGGSGGTGGEQGGS